MSENKSNKNNVNSKKTTQKKNTKNSSNKKTTNTKKKNNNTTKKSVTTKKTTQKKSTSTISSKPIKNNSNIKQEKTKEAVKNEIPKININEYVNVLFKEREEKKKSLLLKLFISIILICIILIGLIIFLNNKDSIVDKFLNNEHIKRVVNTKEKSNNKPTKKEYKIEKKEIENTDKMAILTFHRITTQETKDKYFDDDEWVQSVDMFEKQMKYLYDNNYQTLNLDEFNCWYDGECKFSKKTVLLTFDDGDLSFYYLVAPILKKYNLKGTAFIVGSRTKDKEEEEFSDTKRLFITKENIEKSKKEYPNVYYESHSYNFHDGSNKKKVYDMTRVELQEDFDSNKQFGFKYIAYPYGNYDEALLEKTEQNGYIMGFTFRHYDYATKDSKRFEIPRFKINGDSNVETIEKIVNY